MQVMLSGLVPGAAGPLQLARMGGILNQKISIKSVIPAAIGNEQCQRVSNIAQKFTYDNLIIIYNLSNH